MRRVLAMRLWVLVVLAVLGAQRGAVAAPGGGAAPLMREFMGLNVHTVLFRADLYRPVCRLVRDYHGLDWDIGNESNYAPRFPFARNQVNWEQLYGGWKQAGYSTDVCVMFDTFPAKEWRDVARDAFGYGHAFARFFGPSGTQPLAESVEIGNEPGLYDDASYRAVFEQMARGMRQGDPKLTIATCAMTAGTSDRYAKSLSCVEGLESLYDVISMHTYAQAEGWPTWRRSYPEDPSIAYLRDVQAVQAWRDAHAPGKQVWVTEFGWDASTKPAPATGDFSKWVGVTDVQQAQYLVRSFLAFAAMGVDRAYLFWFNDEDAPQVHGSSGLTRNYAPKPSFYAVAHLYQTLGEYRFTRVVAQRPGEVYVYEFSRGDDTAQRVWAAWSPTGSGRAEEMTFPAPAGEVTRAERMPLKQGPAEAVGWRRAKEAITLTVGEAPVYVWWRGSGIGDRISGTATAGG